VLGTLALVVFVAQSPAPAAVASPAPPPMPSPAPSPAALPGLSPAKAEAVETRIRAAMERLGIPGLQAAVVTERRLRWSGAYGTADLENSVPVRTETVFRLASVTKPMTATAVLQLVEAGKVDLDAPIQRYVPAFPPKQWPVTVRHLLSHQSGVRNWTEEEFHNTRHYATIADSLAIFKDDPLLFEPGSRTQYTSLGYNLMGAVVEGVSGKPFLDYLAEHVFAPAGMTAARGDDVRAIIPHRAGGYQRTGEGALLNSPISDTSNRTAGGGLVATAEDVARFASAFQRGALVRPSTARAAYGRQRTRQRDVTGYGLGWIVGQPAPRPEVYHTGGQPRVSTVLYMLPRSGLAVVLLCNLEGVSDPLLALAREVAGALLD
jgi:CubicO group peptidase (beta-lactamase class C family)